MEYSIPGIVISVEQGWSEEEVSKLRKGAHSRIHLTSVPNSRTYDLVHTYMHTYMTSSNSVNQNWAIQTTKVNVIQASVWYN